jgi:serine/threonine-protein kinase RsbW
MGARVCSLRLPGRPDEVRTARRFVADVLGRAHAYRDEAVLLVSETATNAVEHSGSGCPGGHFTITVTRTDTWARVVVADEGSLDTPCFCRAGPESTEGRGSEILDGCASRWGFVRGPEGTRVWFDVGSEPADQFDPVGLRGGQGRTGAALRAVPGILGS